jgi:Rieske Fe-S protein
VELVEYVLFFRHPIGMQSTYLITRRDSIQRTAWLLGGLCACQMSQGADVPHSTSSFTPVLEEGSYEVREKQIRVDLGKTKMLSSNGDAVILNDQQHQLNLVVIRLGPEKYKVLTAACTHAGRPLAYNRHRKVLQCVNFHHSIFDLEGRVVKGPAPDPIKTYAAQTSRGVLTIAL